MYREKKLINIFLCISILISFLLLFSPVRALALSFIEIILNKKTSYYDYNMLRIFIFAFSCLTAFFFAILFYNAENKSKFNSRNIAEIFCCTFSAILLFFILFNPGWMINDDNEFISTIALKKIRPMHTENGRFWNQYEYNILLLTPFYNRIAFYYVINAIEYILFSLFEFLIIRFIIKNEIIKHSAISDILFCFLHISIHAIYIQVFNDIIFGEKLLCTFILMIIYFLLQAHKQNKLRYWAGGLICSVLATYLKEPVFGALIILAVSILLVYRKQLSKEQIIFSTLLIINGIIYAVLYYFFSYKKAAGFYQNSFVSGNRLVVLLNFFVKNPYTLIISILFIYKLIMLIKEFKKNTNYLNIVDCFLAASFAYFFALYLLRMNTDTYFYPCYALAFPSLFIELSNLFEKKSKLKKLLIPVCTLFIIPSCYLGYYDMYRLHKCRSEDFEICKTIAGYANKNGTLYWYTGENNTNWHKQILKDYIIFINDNPDFDFIETDKIPENLTSGDFLIYTDSISAYESIPENIQELTEFRNHYYIYTAKN